MDEVINPSGVPLFVLQITFLVLVWVSISLRAVVTLWLLKRVSLDDLLMFASVLLYTAFAGISIWGILYGSAQIDTNLLEGERNALHSWFLCEIIYPLLSALIRTSIAVFLLRIATAKAHRYIIYTALVFIWVLSIAYFFIVLFQCSPTSFFYDQVIGESGTCIDADVIPRATLAHSVVNATADFILALLPVAILWRVKLSRGTKAGIAVLLGMGILAGAALIIRIPHVKFVSVFADDFLEETDGAALWSVVEMALGIIGGCAATLRPLAKPGSFRQATSMRRESDSESNLSGSSDVQKLTWSRPLGMQRVDDGYPNALALEKTLAGVLRDQHADADEMESQRRPSCAQSVWDFVTEDGFTIFNNPNSVQVETSIDITREPDTEVRKPSGLFPIHGSRTITINGPVSQGLSTHTI
ncbi:integral membrane protein [Cercophora scortea]|uniref:Integral membrane protein n=1 Tax=Cercophora scortea TaxID=314031 RepID=A0AAE0J5K3_9PEZI|nr:integral membrane protein [Cercophora scortea]